MYKISTKKLLKMVELLDRSNTAINRLERSAMTVNLYPELKKELMDFKAELTEQYVLDEILDMNARDAKLERDRESAAQKLIDGDTEKGSG